MTRRVTDIHAAAVATGGVRARGSIAANKSERENYSGIVVQSGLSVGGEKDMIRAEAGRRPARNKFPEAHKIIIP